MGLRNTLLIGLILLAIQTMGQQEMKVIQQVEQLLSAGDYARAEQVAANLDPESWEYAVVNAQLLQRRGRSDKAEELLSEFVSSDLELSPKAEAAVLNELGIVQWSQGNYNEAKQYLGRALDIYEDHFPDDDAYIAGLYNNIGLVESNENPTEAESCYVRAMKGYESAYGRNDPRLAQIHSNIGLLAMQNGEPLEALYEFGIAEEIWKKEYPNGHPNLAFNASNTARAYQLNNDMSNAWKNYEVALAGYQQAYGTNHPDIASVYNQMANYNLELGEYEAAFQQIQQAFKANIAGYQSQDPYSNPPLADYYHPQVLLNSLLYKARAHYRYYRNFSLKLRDIKYSLATLELADDLIQEIRKQSQDEQDKIALGAIAKEVYAQGVRAAYAGFEGAVGFENSFKRKKYAEQLLYFMDQSKSSVLLQAISDTKAKSFSGVPAELLDREKAIKANLAYYQRLIADKPDERKLADYREEIIRIQREYDTFISELEANYPNYYQLKYQVEKPTIASLQKLLRPTTEIVNYFLDNANGDLYQLNIDKKRARAARTDVGDNLNKYIAGINNGIRYQIRDVYQFSAENLYAFAFAVKPKRKTTELIIIPSGALGTVSFEALLTKRSENDISYAQLPFLVNQYDIQYTYSTALLTDETDRGDIKRALLLAPVNFNTLPDLPNTETELDEIYAMLSGNQVQANKMMKDEVGVQTFMSSDIAGFDCIHMATHGYVDPDKPALSKVYFGKSGNQDGILYAGDVYNLSLDAQLVTLSACQTGTGQLQQGEGIIGLSRALLYAGAHRIVVSLWSVDDLATARLMSAFYSGITNKESYSSSLAAAKRYMIKEVKAEPFYWAPFILID